MWYISILWSDGRISSRHWNNVDSCRKCVRGLIKYHGVWRFRKFIVLGVGVGKWVWEKGSWVKKW